MNEIQIREATAADAELIATLSRQTFYDAFAGDNSKADMDKFMDETFTPEKLIKEVGAAGNKFQIGSGFVELVNNIIYAIIHGITRQLYCTKGGIG